MATADRTVIALGRAEATASRYIGEIQGRLERQDRVRYVLHAMGTSLEGSTEDILAVVAELHAVPFELGIPRQLGGSSETASETAVADLPKS